MRSSARRSDGPPKRRRRDVLALVFASVASIAGTAVITVWSFDQTIPDASPNTPPATFSTVSAIEGSVGSTLNLSVSAAWPSAAVGSNSAAGVVTSVDIENGETVNAGAVLYSVNLNDVTVAQGEIPAFRDLALGSKGADVGQLQAFLKEVGMYSGKVDGEIGPLTADAVKRWQLSQGREPTGVVRAADVIFVPVLPARIKLDERVVSRGALLTGGEPAIFATSVSPRFSASVTPEQATLIPTGASAAVDAGGRDWPATVVSSSSTDSNTTTLVLEGPDGASVCGTECDAVPIDGSTTYRSRIVLVPEVDGIVIPIAAIRSTVDQSTYVLVADGNRVEIRLIASARGQAVVEGVEVGTIVRVGSEAE
ncbi:putative peptidoglycan binding domain protein [Rathayibacter tanaceti]|nr:putative peptidoglycan binding domain protein [Rathayibacter tanaceti]